MMEDDWETLGWIVVAIIAALVFGIVVGMHVNPHELTKTEIISKLDATDKQRIAIEYMKNASWRHTLCDANNFPMGENKETKK